MPAHKIIFRLGLVGVAAVGTASIAVSAPALGTAIRGDDTVPDKFRDPNREEVHIKASKLNNPFSQRVIPINSRMDNGSFPMTAHSKDKVLELCQAVEDGKMTVTQAHFYEAAHWLNAARNGNQYGASIAGFLANTAAGVGQALGFGAALDKAAKINRSL